MRCYASLEKSLERRQRGFSISTKMLPASPFPRARSHFEQACDICEERLCPGTRHLAAHLFPLFQVRNAPNVEPHRSVELERVAARCNLLGPPKPSECAQFISYLHGRRGRPESIRKHSVFFKSPCHRSDTLKHGDDSSCFVSSLNLHLSAIRPPGFTKRKQHSSSNQMHVQ